jgi:hypothetical protein
MYVAALAYPLTTEYVLLDTAQYLAAKDCLDGLFAFVESHPDLNGPARRFRSLAALRRHCAENGVEVVGDLHGCPGEKDAPQLGNRSV